MSKLKAIISIGVSASGKSTWAKEQCLQYNWTNIERDIIREFLLATKFQHNPNPNGEIISDNIWRFWEFKNEKLVTEEFNIQINRAVKNNLNIVCSDTNLNKGRRDALKLKLEALGYEVEYKIFGEDLSLEELWKRDGYRKNTIGFSAISQQYKTFREEFPKYQLKDVSDKPKAIIFDIDGSITLGPHNRSPYAWSLVEQDLPNPISIILCNQLYENGYDVIFLSGRDSICREETLRWLINNTKLNQEYIDKNLYMRNTNDMRKDTVVKLEMFFSHIDGKYNVKYCIEDRPSVYRQYIDLGITPFFIGNSYIEF